MRYLLERWCRFRGTDEMIDIDGAPHAVVSDATTGAITALALPGGTRTELLAVGDDARDLRVSYDGSATTTPTTACSR